MIIRIISSNEAERELVANAIIKAINELGVVAGIQVNAPQLPTIARAEEMLEKEFEKKADLRILRANLSSGDLMSLEEASQKSGVPVDEIKRLFGEGLAGVPNAGVSTWGLMQLKKIAAMRGGE